MHIRKEETPKPVQGVVSVSNLPATQPVSGTVSVSNLPAVQPVSDNSGSLTVDGTVAVSNLPPGASTASNQTDGSQKTRIVDALGNTASMLDPSTPTAAWGTKGVRVLIGQTDVISNIPVVLEYDHHQLHEGEMFRWSTYVSSLASGNNKDVQLVVPSIVIPAGISAVERTPHFRFNVVATDLAQAFFYELPTISVAGTPRTPIAMERNGTYSPGLQIKEDPTVTSVGTLLWQGLLAGSKQSAGDIASADNEFVLKNNTAYLFRVTSGAAGNKVLVRFVWYEDLGV